MKKIYAIQCSCGGWEDYATWVYQAYLKYEDAQKDLQKLKDKYSLKNLDITEDEYNEIEDYLCSFNDGYDYDKEKEIVLKRFPEVNYEAYVCYQQKSADYYDLNEPSIIEIKLIE